MPRENLAHLVARMQKAQQQKDQRRALNKAAYDIAMPQRNAYADAAAGASRMKGVYTSLGMSCVNNFVNHMQHSLTPPFSRWAQLVPTNQVPADQQDAVAMALDLLTEQLFDVLHASNFATASAEMYYDLCVGTGALLVNPGQGDMPVCFQAVPMAQIALEEGPFGTIDAVFRRHIVPARLILRTWPDATLPPTLAQLLKESPHRDITVHEITHRQGNTSTWHYEVLWLGSAGPERLVRRVQAYNPWIIVRWAKMPGEVEGRGPLLQALPDLKMHNHGKEMAAICAQMNAFGSYTMEEDGVLDTRTAQISPGGFLIVKNNPGGPHAPSIASLPRVGSIQDQQFFFEGLEESIKRTMLDNKLPDQTAAVRSPTEIASRIKEFQVDFGTAFGRLMFEFITPLFATLIARLADQGSIRVPVIERVHPISGQVEFVSIADQPGLFTIKMLSPVAQQQALDEVQNAAHAIAMAQAVDPRLALVGYKAEELPEFFAHTLGMPSHLVRTPHEQTQALESLALYFTTQTGDTPQ